jgi:uncharacterized protein YegJ (DUF2314 family)
VWYVFSGRHQSLQAILVDSALFAIGLGLLLAQRWAIWTFLIGVIGVSVWRAYLLFTVEFNAWALAGIAVAVPAVWLAWRALYPAGERAPTQAPPVGGVETHLAVVLLTRRLPALKGAQLASAVSKACGHNIPAYPDERRLRRDDPKATEFVLGNGPEFIVRCGHYGLVVWESPENWFGSPSQVARGLGNVPLAQAVRGHQAHIGVALVAGAPDRAAEQVICRIAADLAERGDVLAVAEKRTQMLAAWDDMMPAALRNDDPLHAVFSEDAAAAEEPDAVAEDDPRMLAAQEEARRRWPEFVEAFEQRDGDQEFGVRCRFAADGAIQHVWIAVTAIENDMVYGRFPEDMEQLADWRPGERVRVPQIDVEDWFYQDEDGAHGGFSLEVLRQIRQEELER